MAAPIPDDAPVITATGVYLFTPAFPLNHMATPLPSKRTLGKMLEVLVGFVVVLLVVGGVLIMIGPNLKGIIRRVRSARPATVPTVFQSRQREAAPPGLNPKTQRVLVAAARLSNWLRTHAQEELSREVRAAAGRITSNEAAGLYALQTVLRKVRALNTDESSQERLKTLSNELRVAVQDRFEQLELLPFRT